MKASEALIIEREIRIAARPETVFSFFTDPAKIIQWKGETADLTPEPGGVFRVEFDRENVARGEFVEVVPPQRLVFTWGWEDPSNPIRPGTSTVEVALIPDGDGTIVRLIHRDLPPQAVARHAEGWDLYLPRLAAVAARQPD